MDFGNISNISAQDVYRFAIETEKTTRDLYDKIAIMAKDNDIKNLFKILADSEDKHRMKFSERLSEIRAESEIPALDINLKSLIYYFSTNLFSREILNEKLRRLKDVEGIFEFAMGIELDHVLFYSETRSIVAASEHNFIDEIINEERAHFVHLLQLKRAKEV
jgi:rubrerythrin